MPLLIGTNAGETVMWIWNRGEDPTPPYGYREADVQRQVAYDSSNNQTLLLFYNASQYQARYNISDVRTHSHQ